MPRLTYSRSGVFLPLALAPVNAFAHGSIQGMGAFSGGLVHPLLTPAHLLALLSLGLWLGQQQPLRLRAPLLAFLPFAAAGLLATTRFAVPSAAQAVLTGLALCVAILVAAAARAPRWIVTPIFALAGLALGLDSGVDGGPGTADAAITLCATGISLSLCFVNFAYYVSLIPPRTWTRVGIRVAGSWIAAICLLVLAFSLSGKSPGS